MKIPIETGKSVLQNEGVVSFVLKTTKYILNNSGHAFKSRVIGYPLMRYQTRSLPSQANKIRQLEQSDEWLLVVLDACRYDRFEMLFDSYFEGTLSPVQSEGYNTFQYVRRTWPDYHHVTYVTGAAPINATEFEFDNDIELQGMAEQGERLAERYSGYRPVDHLENIVEVWRTDWDEHLGVCPPEPVTTTATEHAKAASELVVHYFQPHIPYIGKECELSDKDAENRLRGGAIGMGIWERAQNGDISRDRLFELYDSNLERVLDSVCYLIRNTDFDKTIITGDHGEALGEYGLYGHKSSNPYTRIVPWANVNSVLKDPSYNKEHEITTEVTQTEKQATVEDRLESLGYI